MVIGVKVSVFLVFASLIFSDFVWADCKPSKVNDPVLYDSDFHWGYSMSELLAKSAEIYESPKRLAFRAYYDEKIGSYVMPLDKKVLKIPAVFLKSVQSHIQVALDRHFADGIFFPDMGHAHLFIPDQLYTELDKIDFIKNKPEFYERAFSNKSVKFLYHTAEQLTLKSDGGRGELLSDPYLQWRYYSRNVVGQNDGTDNVSVVFAFENKRYNSLETLEGYRYFGAGFNLSANKNGCFSFTHGGKKYFYDLNMEGLPAAPNTSNGDQGESL